MLDSCLAVWRKKYQLLAIDTQTLVLVFLFCSVNVSTIRDLYRNLCLNLNYEIFINKLCYCKIAEKLNNKKMETDSAVNLCYSYNFSLKIVSGYI